MSKSLVQILYNPSSLSSADLTADTESVSPKPTAGSQALSLFEMITRLSEDKLSAKTVFDGLVRIKRFVSLPLPVGSRLNLLQNFNRLVALLASRFTQQAEIFQACIQTISLFKEDIEARPNPHSEVIRREWVELEKSIYTLSSWEAQLDYFWSEAQ